MYLNLDILSCVVNCFHLFLWSLALGFKVVRWVYTILLVYIYSSRYGRYRVCNIDILAVTQGHKNFALLLHHCDITPERIASRRYFHCRVLPIGTGLLPSYPIA